MVLSLFVLVTFNSCHFDRSAIPYLSQPIVPQLSLTSEDKNNLNYVLTANEKKLYKFSNLRPSQLKLPQLPLRFKKQYNAWSFKDYPKYTRKYNLELMGLNVGEIELTFKNDTISLTAISRVYPITFKMLSHLDQNSKPLKTYWTEISKDKEVYQSQIFINNFQHHFYKRKKIKRSLAIMKKDSLLIISMTP